MAETDDGFVGPTYHELTDPAAIPEDLREAARMVRLGAGRDPLNLYNLHWMDDLGEVTAVVVPRELTGVTTRVALMLGQKFPAGVVHSGAAYTMLMERQLHGEIRPGETRLVVPSSGAFGVGAAWVARLMGYGVTAVVPKTALPERRASLEALGARVVEGGKGPADVLETIDAAWSVKEDSDVVLNPYDDFGTYRYHALVTARAAQALSLSLAQAGMGTGRPTAYVAPGGAGALMAAGEELAGATRVAAEPATCAPLAFGTWAPHSVPDTGPRYPLWTDNVMAVDAAVAVDAAELAAAQAVFAQSSEALEAAGLREAAAQRLSGVCGPAACLAFVAALKAIRYFGWGSNDLVIVSAPEGRPAFDAFNLDDLRSHIDRVREARSDGVIEASTLLRRRWLNLKYGPWVERRGKGEDALRRQEDADFWAEQRRWTTSIDQRILAFRGPA